MHARARTGAVCALVPCWMVDNENREIAPAAADDFVEQPDNEPQAFAVGSHMPPLERGARGTTPRSRRRSSYSRSWCASACGRSWSTNRGAPVELGSGRFAKAYLHALQPKAGPMRRAIDTLFFH